MKTVPARVYWIRDPSHQDVTTQGYVGYTVKPVLKRFNEHCFSALSKGSKRRKRVGEEIAARGRSGVVVETLCIASRDYCLDLERRLRPVPFVGWNHGAGGRAPAAGRKISEATRRRLVAVRATRPPVSDETRKRMSACKLGNLHNLGRPQSDEAKEKLRAANLGKKASAETRAKLSAAHVGRKRDPEAVEKTAEFHRGRKRSEETRQRMRDGRAAARARRNREDG